MTKATINDSIAPWQYNSEADKCDDAHEPQTFFSKTYQSYVWIGIPVPFAKWKKMDENKAGAIEKIVIRSASFELF